MELNHFDVIIIHPDSSIASDVAHSFKNKHVYASAFTNVKDMPVENKAFVSPANSLLFMDGGIDMVYSREMFPGVEHTCKEIVRKIGMQTSLGRYYLPVGSAIVAQTGPYSCLVAAPTMFLPHDVSMTRNAYHAMMAALMAFRKYRKQVPQMNALVCPLLCTGYGKMSIPVAADQMRTAYNDFLAGTVPKEIMHEDLHYVFVTESMDAEQPDNFDNREIKEINI